MDPQVPVWLLPKKSTVSATAFLPGFYAPTPWPSVAFTTLYYLYHSSRIPISGYPLGHFCIAPPLSQPYGMLMNWGGRRETFKI